jgi:protoporphyrinogen oxidase
MLDKRTCIIGAGPAGLTAAIEFQTRTGRKPLILEMTGDIGGISKTVNYKGNRIDIGGHRFFSQSDEVMKAWADVLPIEGSVEAKSLSTDLKMLVRKRLSRILFLKKLFNYPLSLNIDTLNKMGIITTIKIGISYVKVQLSPVKPEVTLEDFFVNRFGKKLYTMFFRDYTKKVWGVSCRDIPKDWGIQRVKGLSVWKVISHAIKSNLFKTTLSQKNIEISLINQFLYPKYGPGYYWEKVAQRIIEGGGEILLHHQVIGLDMNENNVCGIRALNNQTGELVLFPVNAVFSSMPVRDLIKAIGEVVPHEIQAVAKSLVYRDFITIGVLIPINKCINLPDNWIYVQEKDVIMGRIQIFNNWSPGMVSNPAQLWLGLEYFCNEDDDLWTKSDKELMALAARELVKIHFITHEDDVVDGTVVRMRKAYPAYFGGYRDFHKIREFTDSVNNLYLIGRNGMHRYNNMDHSMLTAMAAVTNLIEALPNKNNIWAVNAENEYHEKKLSV